MTDQAHGQSVRDDLSCVADFLDEIEVDSRGKCKWADVANAQTHIRAALRCWAATAPKARPVPAPVGLEREDAISKAKAALHGVVSYLNADNDKHGARARSSTDSIIDKLVAALSPDHRTEPASAPIGPRSAGRSDKDGAEFDQAALDVVNQIEKTPADWHPARRKAHAQCLIIEALKVAASQSPVECDNTPRLTDNDEGEITVALAGKELRGWSYASDDERRAKMLAAREYVEGFCDGRAA